MLVKKQRGKSVIWLDRFTEQKVFVLVLSELILEEEMTHMQRSSYNGVKSASVKQFGCHSSILTISQCLNLFKK